MARQKLLLGLLVCCLAACVVAQAPNGGLAPPPNRPVPTPARTLAPSPSPSTNSSSTVSSTTSSSSLASSTLVEPSSSSSSAVPSQSSKSNSPGLILETKIDPTFGILGALLILSGAPMGFWGGRNRWSSYFLTGAYAGSLVVSVFVFRWGVEDQDHDPSSVIRGMYLLASIVGGLVTGGVAIIFWKGTRFIVGAGGGFVLSLFILSLHDNVLIRPLGPRWILIIGLSTVGFVLATIPKIAIYVTCAATAGMGSAAVVLGIDCFSTAGLKEYWVYILGFDGMFPRLNGYFPLTTTMQAELGVMAGLFFMGSGIQWRLLELIQRKVKYLKQLDAERRIVEDAAAYRQGMALEKDLSEWEERHGAKAGQPAGMGGGRRGGREGELEEGRGAGHKTPETPSTPGFEVGGRDYLPVLGRDPTLDLDAAPAAPLSSPALVTEDVRRDRPSTDDRAGLDEDVASLKERIKTLEEVREMRQSIEKMRAELSSDRSTGSGSGGERASKSSKELDARPSATFSANSHGSSSNHALTDPAKPLVEGKGRIDFERFRNDRSLVRPPGAPATYLSSPTVSRPIVARRESALEESAEEEEEDERPLARIIQTETSPTTTADAPMSTAAAAATAGVGRARDPATTAVARMSGVLSKRSTMIDLSDPSDAQGRPLPLDEHDRILHRVQPSRSGDRIVFTPPATTTTSRNPVQTTTKTTTGREGGVGERERRSVMSIEELESRHREKIRSVQVGIDEAVKAEAVAAGIKRREDEKLAREKERLERERVERERRERERRKSRHSIVGLVSPITTAVVGGGGGGGGQASGGSGSSGSHHHGKRASLASQLDLATQQQQQRRNRVVSQAVPANEIVPSASKEGQRRTSRVDNVAPVSPTPVVSPPAAKKSGPTDWLDY